MTQQQNNQTHRPPSALIGSFLIVYLSFLFLLMVAQRDLTDGLGVGSFFLLLLLLAAAFGFHLYYLQLRERGWQRKVNRWQDQFQAQKLKTHEQLQQIEKLTEENEKYFRKDKTKSEFLSTLAHQLKMPLAGAKWSLDILLNEEAGPLTDEQQDILLNNHENNEKMIHMIDNLLNLDRIEAGRFSVSPQPVSVKKAIDEVLGFVLPRAKQKQIELDLVATDGLPSAVADPEKLRQVFQNLLDNAIKYTMKGGRVAIDLSQTDGQVLVNISDTGVGIPANQRDQIFDKFSRGSNAQKIDSQGTGIGLYIVKEILEQLHGRIEVTSREGEGSTFLVYLPIAQECSEPAEAGQ